MVTFSFSLKKTKLNLGPFLKEPDLPRLPAAAPGQKPQEVGGQVSPNLSKWLFLVFCRP